MIALARIDVPAVLMVLRRVVVVVMVVVMMSVPAEPPEEEAYPGNHQNHAHDVTLLALNGMAELKSNQCEDASQHNRGKHMSDRSEQTGAGGPSDGPVLGASHHGEWHPMVGQDGMQ